MKTYSIILGLFVLLFLLPSVYAYFSNNALQGSQPIIYYNFDESGGNSLIDRVFGRNNGTLFNGAVNKSGILNRAYELNKSRELVSIPYSIDFNFSSGNFSFSGWTYINHFVDDSRVFGTSGIRPFFLTTNTPSSPASNFTFIVYNRTNNIVSIAGGSISTGRWIHLAGTGAYNGTATNVTLYVNGTAVASGRLQGITNFTNFTYFYFNNGSAGLSENNITYDEWGFWNKTLNFSEISALYNNGSSILYTSGFEINSEVFNTVTTSGTREIFSINITYDPGLYSAIQGILFYNNTQYSSGSVVGGNNILFNTSIIIPSTSAMVVKNFTWMFTLVNNSGSNIYLNGTTHTQTINPLVIDNCTTNTQQILNFTLFDEDARTELNGTIEVIVDLFTPGTSNIIITFNRSYSFVAGGLPARVCIGQSNSTYEMDYQVRYYSNTSLYVVEHKFAQNLNITNTTAPQKINLYDLLDARSTPFTLILQSSDLSEIRDAVIDIQRQYLDINQFISVESPLTDNAGTTIGNLLVREVYYNFVVTKDGELLGTFNGYRVQCQNEVTGDCRITLNLVEATTTSPNFENYGNISINYEWFPNSRQLNLNFISTDSLTHLVAWNVSRLDNFGNTTICTNSATATIGTFICNIPTIYGNTSIMADLYSDGLFLGRSYFSLLPSSQDIFRGTKVVLAILMYTTLTLLFIANPITILIGAGLGMTFAVMFHVIDGGTLFGNASILLWFLLGIGILIHVMRNRN